MYLFILFYFILFIQSQIVCLGFTRTTIELFVKRELIITVGGHNNGYIK